MRRKAFTLIELLVVVAIIALLISILLPSLARARELSKRSVCAANIKGIGTAIATYANDNDQVYPIPPAIMPGGAATVNPGESGTYFIGIGNTRTANYRNLMTTTASATVCTSRGFWMLIRDGATAPKQFVCPSSDQSPPDDTDPMLYYDFRDNTNLSYGMQIPFGASARPTTDRDPRMPLAADRGWYSPYMEKSSPDTAGANSLASGLTSMNSSSVPDDWKKYNSPNHGGQGDGEGENVMYSDFHVEFQKRPIEGIGWDNIYTRWNIQNAVNDVDRLRGVVAPEGKFAPFSDTDTVIYP